MKESHKKAKASVNPLAKDHWQMDVGVSVFAKGNDKYPMDAWLARPGKDRPTPHTKINECDH